MNECQAQCATRSAATRSVAQRAHATHARRAHNTTVQTLLWTRNCARTARCVHGLHCTSRVAPVLCVPRSQRFLVAFLHTADRMFSKDSSFQAALASSPGKLREACASRGFDQPGVLAAYVEDVLADMEQQATVTPGTMGILSMAIATPSSSSSLPLAASCASHPLPPSLSPGLELLSSGSVLAPAIPTEKRILPTDIGVGPIVSIGTPIVYPASSLPASSSFPPLPLPSPPLEFSTSVVSSASGDAWEQASRESYISLVNGRFTPKRI